MKKRAFDIAIRPSSLKGEVIAPPSKSISHRAVICAGLSSEVSKIEGLAISNDISATVEAMRQFGACFNVVSEEEQQMDMTIFNPRAVSRGHGSTVEGPLEIDCNESGSTARFLMPFFHFVDGNVTYTGQGRLSIRPFTPYLEIFQEQGIQYSAHNGGLPLSIKGQLKPGEYRVVGNISSQFITGLLFVLPLLDDDSEIRITTPLESKDYIELTLDCLKAFGIEIRRHHDLHYLIPGRQKYTGTYYKVEGDYSQGAFWLVAKALGEKIDVVGLEVYSKQADKAILSIIEQFNENSNCDRKIDVSQCPDLVPIISVLSALKPGTTHIVNAERVRLKESDRIKAMATELKKLGADIEETMDGLLIQGKARLEGGLVFSWDDHRIAMALAIASLFCEDDVTIEHAHVVDKSYPTFWAVFSKLGGQVNVKYHG